MKASLNTARITPKKLNLIADMVRGKRGRRPERSQVHTQKGARIRDSKSAVSNAETNFKQEKDSLYVKEIYVTKALTQEKRADFQGRMHPIRRETPTPWSYSQ